MGASVLPDIDEQARSLNWAAGQLTDLNATSERDFLAIGASLGDLSDRARSITESASAATSTLHNGEMDSGIASFKSVVERLRAYLSQTERGLDKSSRTLRDVYARLNEAEQPLLQFRKIVQRLKIFGVATKIESARITQVELGEGFQTIAEDVEKLSGHITSSAETILSRLLSLKGRVEGTLFGFSKRTGEGSHGREALDKVASQLAALEEKYAFSSSGAAGIRTKYEEIAGAIRQIVSSLQFHDITRQQIEHVIEALIIQHEALGTADGPQDGEGRETAHEVLSLLPDIIELQVRQLANSQHELLSAIEATVKSLNGIAKRVEAVQREIITLVNSGTGQGFLAEIRQAISSILAHLTLNVSANEAFYAAMESIIETMNAVSAFIVDIEDIGDQIELIALNAQIKSARTGSGGAALGVIAEATRILSDNAKEKTSLVSQALQAVHDQAEMLVSETTSLRDRTTADQVVSDIDLLLGSFDAIDGQVSSLVTTMKADAISLNREIDNTIKGVSIHVYANRILGDVASRLREAVTALRRQLPATCEAERAEHLRKLENRYTMHQERDIHRALYGQQESCSEDRLGENVELF